MASIEHLLLNMAVTQFRSGALLEHLIFAYSSCSLYKIHPTKSKTPPRNSLNLQNILYNPIHTTYFDDCIKITRTATLTPIALP